MTATSLFDRLWLELPDEAADRLGRIARWPALLETSRAGLPVTGVLFLHLSHRSAAEARSWQEQRTGGNHG
jgi:hypothetical protein